MRHHVLACVLLATQAIAQPTPCYDFATADSWARDTMAKHRLDGIGVSVSRGGDLLHERTFGNYDATTVVPIASASKLVSACVLMSLVDSGDLRLDDTASKYLSTFTGAKGRITLRQMFSHTSGLADSQIISVKSITLEQAVNFIGRNVPLAATPGSEFRYGGVSMAVAGRICEIVTGLDWEALVRRNLSLPLGITTLDYQGLGATKNYRVGGSAQCRLADYRKIVQMLAQGGVYRGRRILSQGAIDAMFRDQTNGARIVSSPAPTLRYGIGCWLDRRGPAGEVLQISSPGAFGFTPWVDLSRGVGGVVMVRYVNRLVAGDIANLQTWSQSELPYRGSSCFGAGTSPCGRRVRLSANGVVRQGEASFALAGDGAPARSPGFLLISAAPSIPGWPLLGVRLHVAAPVLAITALQTDAMGRVRLPLPLPTNILGAKGYAQLVTAEGASCRSLGASPGLALEVLE